MKAIDDTFEVHPKHQHPDTDRDGAALATRRNRVAWLIRTEPTAYSLDDLERIEQRGRDNMAAARAPGSPDWLGPIWSNYCPNPMRMAVLTISKR